MAVRVFNTQGCCTPEENYMVDISDRVMKIKTMVDEGKYFTINKARQYGKTTTLRALAQALGGEYRVMNLDFQNISEAGFRTEENFVRTFCRLLVKKGPNAGMPDSILSSLKEINQRTDNPAVLDELFDILVHWCSMSDLPVVLIIDEVDSASNNQVFLDFLSMLRLQYLERKSDPTYKAFKSVILSGVIDIKNLKRKLNPGETQKFNSPWNIAADFDVDMSLPIEGIIGMLETYESDCHTGMDTAAVAKEIYAWTGGYPFLVSRICLLIDRQIKESNQEAASAWSVQGVSAAAKRILVEKNTLFDSLMGKVCESSVISRTLERILFAGDIVMYNPDSVEISDLEMYGLIANHSGNVAIANRLFESRLYNYFLSVDKMQEAPH